MDNKYSGKELELRFLQGWNKITKKTRNLMYKMEEIENIYLIYKRDFIERYEYIPKENLIILLYDEKIK